MAGLDPVKAKANLAAAKMALQVAIQKDKDGNPRRIGFAFAPGKDKTDHILMIDAKKKGPVLMAEILKIAKDRKALCCGSATFQKVPKPTLYVSYIKKLSGAERKMIEALVAMKLPLKVKLEGADDADDDDADDQAVAAADDDDDAPTEMADADAGDADDAETATADDSDDGGAAAAADADEDEDAETEDAEAEPEPAAAAKPAAPDAAAKGRPPLGAAPEVWHKTRSLMSMNITKLKAAIKNEYKDEAPELTAEIDKNMGQIDRILGTLDHRLAESLDKAHKAKDDAARQAELKNSKAILTSYLKYVNSEPLIAHVDKNPFGVETNLKKVLTASLTHMAKVVG